MEKRQGFFSGPAFLAAALFSALGGALAFFYAFHFDRITILNNEIQNTGHIPFFGFITIIFLKLSEIYLSKEGEGPYAHYKRAFVGTFALGVITEASQIIGPRNADLMDLARNTLGSLIFLGIYFFFDAKLDVPRKRKTLALLLSLTLGLLALSPIAFWKRAYYRRDKAFPVLCDFGNYWAWPFYAERRTTLTPVDAPPEWKEKSGQKVGKLKIKARVHSGFKIQEPYPDWRSYKFLAFDIFSAMPSDTKVEIKITDFGGGETYSDRFNREIPLKPGHNEVRIPIEDIRRAPAGREMDMTAIQAISLFTQQPDKKLLLYLGNIQLIP